MKEKKIKYFARISFILKFISSKIYFVHLKLFCVFNVNIDAFFFQEAMSEQSWQMQL